MNLTCNKAFTLLEIIIFIVILSVLISLSLPNFRKTYQSLELNKSAEDLRYSMLYAQSRAIGKGRVVRLAFDGMYEKYWLEEAEDSDQKKHDNLVFKRFSGRMGRKSEIAPSIKIESLKKHVLFYPDGEIDKVIIYVCQDDRCFTVTSKWQRGSVKMYEGKVNRN